MTPTKTISMNIFFHFVFLGLIVSPLFLPNMPNSHWLGLFVLFLMMNPIIAYFYDWDMNIGASCVPPTSPRSGRLYLLIIMVFCYVFGFLSWLAWGLT